MGIFAGIKYGLIALVLLAGFAAYDYVIDLRVNLEQTRANLATSEANSQLLESEIGKQQEVLDQLQKDFKDITEANKKLENVNQKLVKEYAALDTKFNKINASGEKRDIGNLAVQKTKAIEKIVNRASANALRCVEIAMGSPLTEEEKNATKKSQINPECTGIANPKFVQY